MRIGLFGGSFDPTHVEHINLAKGAIQSLSLDKLIVLPAHTPPHKQGKTLTPDSVRLELCKLAFLDVDKVEVNGYEIEKGGVSYTYETCRYFRSLYPSAQLFWIVGTDMLRNFPTWKNPKEILETTTLAVCARAENNGWLEKEKENFYKLFGKDFALIDYDGKDVSSTKIRVLASAGEDVSAFVGERVAKYIKEERLYEIDGAKEALNLEKQSRKEHSLRVAEMSAQRAPSLGISEKKAITSALFHDCAKNLDRNSPYLDGFVLEKDVPAPVEHQFAGAYLAEKKFGVKDEDILNSIRYHTSGRAGMSALERLIFLADMLEYGRDYDVVAKLRELFWDKTDDLTVCMAVALKESLRFIKEKGAPVYELTVEAEKYYAEKMKNRQQGNSLTKRRKIMTEVTSKELALAACKALADKRGRDIVTVYVREKTALCDYFVLASGSNPSQIRAMGERVEELISKEYNVDPTRTEGVRDGRWAVIDYGDVIVHIFNDDTRLFYHLERLWGDGENLEKYVDPDAD